MHSIVKDPPFSRLDLISCRNVLIYLDTELQDRVMQTFHYALNPGGFLFLGTSERITRHAKHFAIVDEKHRIFQRRDTGELLLPVSQDRPLQHWHQCLYLGRHASMKIGSTRACDASWSITLRPIS